MDRAKLPEDRWDRLSAGASRGGGGAADLVRNPLLPLYLLGALPIVFWASRGGIDHRDFRIIWDAGLAVLHGINPYAANVPFAYPPVALLIATPFAMLPYLVAFALWTVLSVAAFYVAAKPWLPERFPPALAILTPAALSCIGFGQTGLLAGALWLWAFRGSAFAVAALSFKPHLGLLVMPRLVSDRTLLLRSVALLFGMVCLSALVIGYWPEFVDRAVIHGGQAVADNWSVWFRTSVTPLTGYGVAGWLIYAAGGIYFLSKGYNVWTAATATFLISPYGFMYDLPVVCLGLAILIFQRWDEMERWQRLVCSAGFLSPFLVLGGTWWIPPILLACLFVQVGYSVNVRFSLSGPDQVSP